MKLKKQSTKKYYSKVQTIGELLELSFRNNKEFKLNNISIVPNENGVTLFLDNEYIGHTNFYEEIGEVYFFNFYDWYMHTNIRELVNYNVN